MLSGRVMPGEGLEPPCPCEQPGLSRPCLTSSTTRARPCGSVAGRLSQWGDRNFPCRRRFLISGHGKARPRVEVSALKLHGASGLRGPTPLLRLQGDERLVALTRRGNQAAYEALVGRYQARLLAFCRLMLSSREDAEDVLQEVFAAAFNAMLADDRPINVRPWLYRITRNRSLNQ